MFNKKLKDDVIKIKNDIEEIRDDIEEIRTVLIGIDGNGYSFKKPASYSALNDIKRLEKKRPKNLKRLLVFLRINSDIRWYTTRRKMRSLK